MFVGRVFNGSGKAIDKGPPVLAEDYLDIQGKMTSITSLYSVFMNHHTCDISRYRRIPPISRALICPLPDGPPICPISRYDKKSNYVLYFTLFDIQVSISLCKV